MKERKTLDEKDIAVLELIEDPVWFGEFIRSAVEDEDELSKDWKFDNYQKVMLLDESHYLDACTARSTGKTVILETRILNDVVSNKCARSSENEVLFVVQNRSQLNPVFNRFAKFFRRHELLKYYIDKNSINASQYEIKLLNGSLIRCRIVGSTADANIIGLHVPRIYVDEAQVFSYPAWQSLQQVLNSWDEEFLLWVSGVPNGLREKNVLYECDTSDKFSKHNISRLQSPRYTKDKYEEDLKQYGGVEGDDFVHLVLGQHGSPAFSVFDRKMMLIENYPVMLSIMNNLSLEQAGGEFNKLLDTQREIPPNDLAVLAMDCGFSTDPSVLIILYQKNNVWREFARYELRRIKYPIQAKIVEWLDSIYRFNMITIDAGSSGIALGQILQQENERLFKRTVMVDFQGGLISGYNDDGSEVKSRVKPFTIQQLQRWAQNDHIIAFSMQDDELISELERVGFTRDMLGQPKYFVYSPQGGQRGEDHVLASLLTWVYGYYYNYFSPVKPEKAGKYSDLARGGWLVGNRLR